MWVLESKPKSSARTASALNCWAVSLAIRCVTVVSLLHCDADVAFVMLNTKYKFLSCLYLDGII